jgi:hypothetical protein
MNRVFAGLVLACVLGAPLARADEPSAAEIALARRLFAEARTAEGANDWKEALAKLREAISIKETPGLRFHVAYCEEQLGMLVEALVDYDRVEEALSIGAKAEDVARQLGPRREALKKRVPTIALSVPPSVHAPHLSLDGHVLPETALAKPIPVNPGSHHVVVSALGRRAFERDLSLSEGDSAVVVADLPPAAVEAVAPVPEPVARPAGDRPARSSTEPAPLSFSEHGWGARTYVLIGEGLVTVAAGAVAGGYLLAAKAADNRADEVRNRLTGLSCEVNSLKSASQGLQEDCRSLNDALSAGRQDRTISFVAVVGAGAGLAAFAATLIFWPRENASTTAIRVLPAFDVDRAGVTAVGRF